MKLNITKFTGTFKEVEILKKSIQFCFTVSKFTNQK